MTSFYSLYPVLLCLLPVHTVYAQNISEVSFKNYIETLFKMGLIVLAGCGGLIYLTGKTDISLIIFCVNYFLLLFANYFFIGLVSEYKRTLKKFKILFLLSLILCGVTVSGAIYFVFKDFNLLVFNKILFYASLFITFFIVLDIITKLSRFKKPVEQEIQSRQMNEELYPDIYHILLDMHPGFDVEEFCDENFKEELEKRGFHIYRNFQSNYNCTNVSLPSFLNMAYVQDFIEPRDDRYTYDLTYPYYAANKVFSKLKNFNYTLRLFTDSSFYNMLKKYCDCSKSTFIFSHPENYMKKLITFSSVFSIFKDYKTETPDTVLHRPLELFKKYGITDSKCPNFSYMHILAPHPPYFYDENGKAFSKSQYRDVKNYLSYTKYVDKKIVELVDEILSKMKKNSIIILHSDHGRNNMNILMAVRFWNPDDSSCIPEKSSLVNFYRCIFNKYFDCDYEMLEDKKYKINGYFRLKEVDFEPPSA